MILVIDNYDSFTYNLVHLLAGMDEEIIVKRNDAFSADDALALGADAIILSPGPCTPNEAGICLDLVTAAAKAQKPVFGVCLGMQSIAQAFGGRIERASALMHGKTCKIAHSGAGVFAGLPPVITAARYHSLAVARNDLPDCLQITAEVADGEDDEIMALSHRTLPIYGVQFHPESIASEHGAAMISNFLERARS